MMGWGEGRLMRTRGILLVLGLTVLAALPGTPAHADRYTFEKDHTDVRASWDHLGMSRQSARFLDVKGGLKLELEEPETSTVEVSIKVGSGSTGGKELDEILTKSKDFFDAATFPEITFKSTSVKTTSAKTAEVVGDLTINGVTKPATLDVVWNFVGEHPLGAINPVYKDVYAVGFSATTQILRSDWGITRTVPYVSDEIKISIETELKREN